MSTAPQPGPAPEAPRPAPGTPSTPPGAQAPETLRAEYDALALRLAIRGSVDVARTALYQLFFGLLSVGLTAKLAWDRWGTPKPGVVRRLHTGPPLFVILAVGAAVILLALAARSFLRVRRLQREEDALFARFRTLRGALRLEP